MFTYCLLYDESYIRGDILLKTIIVDNDSESVNRLREYMDELDIVKVFTSNDFKLRDIEKLEPELIFMNIQELSCIHIGLIQYMSKHNLSSHLVFIKNNEEVANEPALIQDVKSIVKPFTKEKLATLSRLIHMDIVQPSYPQVEVCLFKHFHFKYDGKRFANVKWRTAKSRELFVYLVQHYKENVRKDVLIELLWPDTTVEKGYDNLYAAIYYLRKLLRELNIGININNNVHGYEIEFMNVTCDMIEFERIFEEITDHLYDDLDTRSLMKLFRKLEKLYIGEYLEEESYVWKENKRDKYRIQYLSIARKIITNLTEEEDFTEAIVLVLHIQKLYPYLDYSYFTLMKLYNEFGDMANVEREYNKLKKMLESEFNTEPNSKVKDWYQGWMKLQFMEK